MKPAIIPFELSMLDELAGLFTSAIRGRREATVVTSLDFRQRVLEHPGFDPTGLIVINGDYGHLIGAVHAVLPPEFGQYDRLKGKGYIIGPYIIPEKRGLGLGTHLLAEAERYLSPSCDQLLVHGLRTPFYHAQEGPRQPYCGSTEFMGFTEDDAFLLKFLEKRGFKPFEVETEVSMLVSLNKGLIFPKRSLPDEFELVYISPQQPWEGPVDWVNWEEKGYGYERYRPMSAYKSIGLVHGGTLIGECEWFPLRHPGRAALYNLRVQPEYRGRGFGDLLLDGGLALMAEDGYQEIELNTSPQRNQLAFEMYYQRGFRLVQEWIIMEKRL